MLEVNYVTLFRRTVTLLDLHFFYFSNQNDVQWCTCITHTLLYLYLLISFRHITVCDDGGGDDDDQSSTFHYY